MWATVGGQPGLRNIIGRTGHGCPDGDRESPEADMQPYNQKVALLLVSTNCLMRTAGFKLEQSAVEVNR
jgi:hypothetical protein